MENAIGLSESGFIAVEDYLGEVSDALRDVDPTQVSEAVNVLRGAKEKKARVWIVGNGGSATTASHFANDLLKMAGLDATSLPDMMPTVLAYGNDQGWENMFSDVLESVFAAGDVLVAISCSGRSKNVLSAIQKAQELDGYVIVLTGACRGEFFDRPTAFICTGDQDIKVQEDCHLAICHAMAGALAKGK